ncbi:uncharacterized protein [Panulirus ornatus]|uniref:uncharacterized protein isoform X4 n=1 Tax=Panulirus ornatus TaxID=150431 RepID=UPI003A872AB9
MEKENVQKGRGLRRNPLSSHGKGKWATRLRIKKESLVIPWKRKLCKKQVRGLRKNPLSPWKRKMCRKQVRGLRKNPLSPWKRKMWRKQVRGLRKNPLSPWKRKMCRKIVKLGIVHHSCCSFQDLC